MIGRALRVGFRFVLTWFAIWCATSGGGSVARAGVIFTDRALFNAAAGAPLTTETFESYAPSGTIDSGAVGSKSFAKFSVASVPNAIKIILGADGFGSFNTTPGGSKFLYLDTDIGFQGSATTFTFPSPIDAIGFSYTGVKQAGTTFTATINAQNIPVALNPNNSTALFWGYVHSPGETFSQVRLTTSTNSAHGVDDISFTPEPAAMPLLVFGAASFVRRFVKRTPSRGR